MSKWVYTFGNGKAEGDASMRNLLGGKGANLAEMNVVGLPVPPGFTVTTEVCTYYYNNDHTYPADLKDQVKAAVAEVEKVMGKKFADANNPLLFSVRSGARVSMPGMMDTVLNLGLNDETVKALAKLPAVNVSLTTLTVVSCRCSPTLFWALIWTSMKKLWKI